jgi:AraC-like DNA-binding protein
VLHVVELLPYYFGPISTKIQEINLVMKYKSLVDYPSVVTFFSSKTEATIKVFFTTLLAISTFGLVLRYLRNNRTKNSFILNWMFSFSLLNLLSVVFIIAYLLGIIGFNNLRFSYADLLMHLAAFVNLAFVLYRPALLDGVSFQSLVLRLQEDKRIPEPDEDTVKLKKYEVIAKRLEDLFAEEKPFLDSELTLEKTAKKLQISTKDLSRTTAYFYELGYPDFVNSWRINYIMEQRHSDPKWQEYSQDMLAELSGFGSRQGLHNAVNRLHGTTPAMFFAQKKKES